MRKSLKDILDCCNLQIVFKNKTRSGNNFHFKDQIPKNLMSGAIYKLQCEISSDSYYGECVRQLNLRTDKHIAISPLTKKQINPKHSFVVDHLIFCNHSASYDDFSILMHENKNFLPELKLSLLIMSDKPSLSTNILAPLYLFARP